MYIVMTGNPFDGFELYGPFDSFDDAAEYGDYWTVGDWWVTRIKEPKEYIQ